jgi:hypothetical protein
MKRRFQDVQTLREKKQDDPDGCKEWSIDLEKRREETRVRVLR